MAFRSPWEAIAAALPRVGEAIAQGIQQSAAIAEREKEIERVEVKNEKLNYQQQISNLLYNPETTATEKQELSRQLTLLNNTPDTYEGMQNFKSQYTQLAPSLETLQTTPGSFIFGGGQTITTPESVIGTIAGQVVSREKEQAAVREQFQTILPTLADTTVDPKIKQDFLDQALLSGTYDLMEPWMQSTLRAFAGYSDPMALEARRVELDTAKSNRDIAASNQRVTTATEQAAIDTAIANRATAQAAAEVATATTAIEIATRETALEAAQKNLEFAEEDQQRAAEAHALSMELTTEQITNLRNRIGYDAQDQSLKNIQSALDTGMWTHLSNEERQGVASYLGIPIGDPEEPSRAFVNKMAERAREFNDAVSGDLLARSLAGQLAESNLNLSEQNLRNAQLNFDINLYDFERAKQLNPIRDAVTYGKEMADAVFAGNTESIQAALNIARNADVNPEAAQALFDMGLTVDKLEGLLVLAEARRDQIVSDDETKSELLRAQVVQLRTATKEQAASIIGSLAQYYPDVASLEQDRRRLTDPNGDIRMSESEYASLLSMVRYKQNVLDKKEAAAQLTEFSKVGPEPGYENTWTTNFVSLAEASGMDPEVAIDLARGYLQAFGREDTEFALRTQNLRLQAALTTEQINQAKAAPGIEQARTAVRTLIEAGFDVDVAGAEEDFIRTFISSSSPIMTSEVARIAATGFARQYRQAASDEERQQLRDELSERLLQLQVTEAETAPIRREIEGLIEAGYDTEIEGEAEAWVRTFITAATKNGFYTDATAARLAQGFVIAYERAASDDERQRVIDAMNLEIAQLNLEEAQRAPAFAQLKLLVDAGFDVNDAGQEVNWITSFISTASEAGIGDGTAAILATSYIDSYNKAETEAQRQEVIDGLSQRLLELQVDAAEREPIEADELEEIRIAEAALNALLAAPPDINNPNAVSNWTARVTDQAKILFGDTVAQVLANNYVTTLGEEGAEKARANAAQAVEDEIRVLSRDRLSNEAVRLELDDAKAQADLFLQAGPTPGNERSWKNQYSQILQRAGYSSTQANLIAAGFLEQWRNARTVEDQQALLTEQSITINNRTIEDFQRVDEEREKEAAREYAELLLQAGPAEDFLGWQVDYSTALQDLGYSKEEADRLAIGFVNQFQSAATEDAQRQLLLTAQAELAQLDLTAAQAEPDRLKRAEELTQAQVRASALIESVSGLNLSDATEVNSWKQSFVESATVIYGDTVTATLAAERFLRSERSAQDQDALRRDIERAKLQNELQDLYGEDGLTVAEQISAINAQRANIIRQQQTQNCVLDSPTVVDVLMAGYLANMADTLRESGIPVGTPGPDCGKYAEDLDNLTRDLDTLRTSGGQARAISFNGVMIPQYEIIRIEEILASYPSNPADRSSDQVEEMARRLEEALINLEASLGGDANAAGAVDAIAERIRMGEPLR